jgi:hypothetical protein
MPEELITPQATTPVAPVTETLATPAETMDSILKQAADIDARLSGNLPPVEAPAITTPEPEKPAETPPEEVKPIVDVAALLKEAGFGEKSLDDVKSHIDKLKARDETWHWAAKNIPGFVQFVTKQMMIGRGVEQTTETDTLSAFEQSLNKPKSAAQSAAPQPVPQDVYEIFKDRVDPNTGEPYAKESIDQMVKDIKSVVDKLGYASKEDIAALQQSREAEKKTENADKLWSSFPSNPIVAKQLEALGETWEGVMPHVARLLVTDVHITNPAQVTERDLANAWNLYVLNNPGGLTKIISNAKTEANTSQEAKDRLPKPITPGGATTGTGKPVTLDSIMNDPTLKPEERLKRITEYAALLDSRTRR